MATQRTNITTSLKIKVEKRHDGCRCRQVRDAHVQLHQPGDQRRGPARRRPGPRRPAVARRRRHPARRERNACHGLNS